MPAGMEVTVCICTHNRPHYVRDCLAGLARQTACQDSFAVLVVDSGSTGDVSAELTRLTAGAPNARVLRVDLPGVSLARNAGVRACRSRYIAYIDDDAIPADDWVASILAALGETATPPAVLGGRALPMWDPSLPADLAPYTVNMVVNVAALLAIGGFRENAGRFGTTLLSDEDVQVAWRLRQGGQSVRYDSRVVVHHQIQAARLTPQWLLSRLYWQGASTVLTRRLLGNGAAVWRELPRRLAVAVLYAPAGLLPRRSAWLIPARWRLAYAQGFVRAAFGWHADTTARRKAAVPPAEATASV